MLREPLRDAKALPQAVSLSKIVNAGFALGTCEDHRREAGETDDVKRDLFSRRSHGAVKRKITCAHIAFPNQDLVVQVLPCQYK